MATLYDLTSDLRQLYDILSDVDADNDSDCINTAVTDALELRDDYESKVDAYAKLIRSLQADAAALKTEEERIAARRLTLEKNSERLKDSLKTSMTLLGYNKITTRLFTVSIQKNPPSLQAAEDMMPIKYWVSQPAKLDRRTILNDLKAGNEIPGATLIQGESLRIR